MLDVMNKRPDNARGLENEKIKINPFLFFLIFIFFEFLFF